MAGPGFVGCRITKNNIGGAVQKMREEVSGALGEGANLILADALTLVPRRSEDLANSGKVVQTGLLTFILSFGDGLPDARAVFQEYGTAHHPAQPYLEPAIENNTEALLQLAAEACHGRVRHTNVRVATIGRVED